MSIKLNKLKSSQIIATVGFVLLFTLIGVHYISSGHAASPAVGIDAASGVLANGATLQSDPTLPNGKYVLFGGVITAGGPPGEMGSPGRINELIAGGLPQATASFFFNNPNTYFNLGANGAS